VTALLQNNSADGEDLVAMCTRRWQDLPDTPWIGHLRLHPFLQPRALAPQRCCSRPRWLQLRLLSRRMTREVGSWTRLPPSTSISADDDKAASHRTARAVSTCVHKPGQRFEKVLRPHARRLAHQHEPPRPDEPKVQSDGGQYFREGSDSVDDPVGPRAVGSGGWLAW